MATLTKNWQNVASYRFAPGTGFICTFYLDAKYSSQSTANNTTTIQTRLNCTVNQGSGGGNGYRFALSYAPTKEGSSYWTFATETISTGSTTITHNNDGKKDVTLSASMRVNYTGLDASMSATVTLPRINRQATITSAPNFNDEENPTITYSNPLGNNVTSLQACISLTGSIDDIAYRDIPKTGTSYTFELTEAERNVLRQATPDKTRTIKFYVKTQYSGNTFYSSVSKTLSIINANPTFTYSVVETNQKAIDVLGTSKALWLIENVSQPKISVVPTAYKYATISNVVVTNGNNTANLTKSPYEATLNAISGTSAILVTDSRGFSASEIIERPLISYIPVAINSFDFKRVNPTSSNLILNASFTYTQTTFNTTNNVPTIKWKCNEDGELHTISTDNYIIDTKNRKIAISNLLLENVISYKEQAELFIYIDDLLTSATNHMPVIKGIPVMDWGEHDVQINGDLFLADKNRENAIEIRNLIKDIYSTNEIKTHKTWIDGKPIYRVVKTFTNYNTLKQGTDIPCSIPNVETVTYQYYQYEYNDEKRVFPLLETSGKTLNICFQPIAQKLHCSGAGTWYARPLTAIIEYTKTTDKSEY